MADDAVPQAGTAPQARTVELSAQWALWGKEGEDRAYRVLASSSGELTGRDFAEVAERYAAGFPDVLPHYTVYWVPDSEGAPGYVGIAIHERASYSQREVRSHYDASGHEIIYSRLFCVRYADLAEHGLTFIDLLGAVREQLPAQDQAPPLLLRVTPGQAPQPPLRPAPGNTPQLAEIVAALLVSTRKVCVIGAEEVPADERLRFIDQVLSLLPYGSRAMFSAATWVSPIAQNLKLRLFFASVPRDDGEQTHHVRWGQRGWGTNSLPESESAWRYLNWLRDTGPRARLLLAEQTAPLRFSDADLRAMVSTLPKDLTISEILEDLADSLSEGDAEAAKAEAQRLERRLTRNVKPTDRERYRGQVIRHGLLGNHPGLKASAKSRIYRTALRLSFTVPISYADYCTIEDVIGGPPRGTLRQVLGELNFNGYLPWLLAARAEPPIPDEDLIAALSERGAAADRPLSEVEDAMSDIRPGHRAAAYDFAVLYLRTRAKDPKAELASRGYLAQTLEAVFPDDQEAQRIRLEDTLLFVHGRDLSRGQIRDLFSEPGLRPTSAFEAAVARLAASRKVSLLIAEKAAEARNRHAGDSGERAADSGEPGLDPPRSSLSLLIRRLAGGIKTDR